MHAEREKAKALQKGKKGGEEEEVAELGICTTPDTVRSTVYSIQPCWARAQKKKKNPLQNTRHLLVVKVTISPVRENKPTIREIQKLCLIAVRVSSKKLSEQHG